MRSETASQNSNHIPDGTLRSCRGPLKTNGSAIYHDHVREVKLGTEVNEPDEVGGWTNPRVAEVPNGHLPSVVTDSLALRQGHPMWQPSEPQNGFMH